jgi:adenylate cyclase
MTLEPSFDEPLPQDEQNLPTSRKPRSFLSSLINRPRQSQSSALEAYPMETKNEEAPPSLGVIRPPAPSKEKKRIATLFGLKRKPGNSTRMQLGDEQHPLELDFNLSEMEGIIDLSRSVADTSAASTRPPSELTAGTSSQTSESESGPEYLLDGSSRRLPPTSRAPVGGGAPLFTNPFALSSRKKGSLSSAASAPSSFPSHSRAPSPSWAAPESWAVDRVDDDAALAEDDTSGSEDILFVPTDTTFPREHRSSSGQRISPANYKLRIYRANNTYHVVSIPLAATVADFLPLLVRKLLSGPDREAHKLFVKEHGRGGLAIKLVV